MKCHAKSGDPIMEPCPHRTFSGRCKSEEACYYNDIEEE